MSKNKRSGKKQHTKNLGDVTINDFANSTVCKNRVKKSNSNVTTIIKKLETDKAWDEVDVDGEINFVEEENEDGTVSVVIKKTSRRRRKNTQESYETCEGQDYPIDVWFLISEYIRPEDVGRFAGICKTSFAVVCTAKFWFNLYRRFYKSVPTLPERLQSENMLRLYGLQTSVIRSLYHMYSPFVEALKERSIKSFEHPDVLIKRQCVLMWHQKQRKTWQYYFKLKENFNGTLSHNRSNGKTKRDLLELLEDISANPEDNCRILQVTCLQFIAVPLVLGLTLKSAFVTLAHRFRYHRLQLGFDSGIQTYSKNALGGSNNTTIILDPVASVKILDWWHPLYPHNHNIEHLLDQE